MALASRKVGLFRYLKWVSYRGFRRYRLTATYVVLLLCFGTDCAHKLLNNYVERLTHFTPNDLENGETNEPEIPQVALKLLQRLHPVGDGLDGDCEFLTVVLFPETQLIIRCSAAEERPFPLLHTELSSVRHHYSRIPPRSFR